MRPGSWPLPTFPPAIPWLSSGAQDGQFSGLSSGWSLCGSGPSRSVSLHPSLLSSQLLLGSLLGRGHVASSRGLRLDMAARLQGVGLGENWVGAVSLLSSGLGAHAASSLWPGVVTVPRSPGVHPAGSGEALTSPWVCRWEAWATWAAWTVGPYLGSQLQDWLTSSLSSAGMLLCFVDRKRWVA